MIAALLSADLISVERISHDGTRVRCGAGRNSFKKAATLSEHLDEARAGIRDERFLILPHEIVSKYVALKGADHERWLTGMRRIVRGAREGQ